MKNLKPSTLPVNTIVEVHEDLAWAGEYIKVDNPIYGIYWKPLDCEDCRGATGTSNTLVDERFTDFKIIAVPFAVVEHLVAIVAEYDERTWTREADREDILRSAFEFVMEESTPQEDLVWKHLNSFENLYMEINEKGQVRTDFNGQVYSPEFDDDVNQWLVTVKTEEGNEIILDARYFVKQQFDKDYL